MTEAQATMLIEAINKNTEQATAIAGALHMLIYIVVFWVVLNLVFRLIGGRGR